METDEPRPVPGFPKYQIYRDSRIENIETKRILKQHISQEYKKVHLSSDKQYTFQVHRLVALTYIPNPDNLPTVDHINCLEKTNNSISNLRWADMCEQAVNKITDRGIDRYIYDTPSGSFQVCLRVSGKTKAFGTYKTIEEARTKRNKVLAQNLPT